MEIQSVKGQDTTESTEKKGKVVGIAKNNPTQVDLMVSPRDLLGSIRENIIDFSNMNKGMKVSTLRKLQKNIEILENNAKAYIAKERALVEEFIVVENDVPVWWNQVTTEKVYEGDGEEKRLAGGTFRVQTTPQGMILVNADGEQYIPKEGEEMRYLQKDIAREEEYTSKMKELQGTPIEVKIILFTEDELNGLNAPTDLTFLNIFVDGKY